MDCEVIRIPETAAELRLFKRLAHFVPFRLIFASTGTCSTTMQARGKRTNFSFERKRRTFHQHMEADN